MSEVKLSRRQKAAATRLKILRAAEGEFLARGFHGATMSSIAAAAGVAGQTVYFVFHTKAALISALIDMLVMGEEEPSPPQETAWWAAMAAEPDAAEALRQFIRGAGPLFQRASRVSEVLRAAALTDDEVRKTYEFHDGLRADAFREVIVILIGKGKLRADLSQDEATDILLSLLSDSTHYLMTVERGWSHDRFIEWMCAALPGLLLSGDR